MKKLVYFLLALLTAAALFTGCVQISAPSSADHPAETGAEDPEDAVPADPEQEDKENTGAGEDTDAPLDVEAFLTELADTHPEASAEELCDLMLENPYFRLFIKEGTEYFYPGLDYEFKPVGVKRAFCIWDSVGGTRAVVYAMEPEDGADTDKLTKSLEEAIDPYWTETPLPNRLFLEKSGKLFFAMYPDELQPVTGPVAEKTRDLVEIFHTYLSEHPEAAPLDIADYFMGHQKIAEMYTMEVQPGQLTGFGDFENEAEITGFSSGAILQPMMSPNTNICYIFRLSDGDDISAFEQQLKDKANLAWNVCMSADTVITEIDGNYVLFLMCSEGALN